MKLKLDMYDIEVFVYFTETKRNIFILYNFFENKLNDVKLHGRLQQNW